MKNGIILILVLLGLYWLFDHASPLPFNHEQFGLYYHGVHRALGIVFLVGAGLVAKFWKPKRS